MTNTTTVTIRGEEYEREMARVEAPAVMEVEDHGLIMVLVMLRYDIGTQGVQLCWSPKYLFGAAMATLAYLHLRQYKKGAPLYALRKNGLVVGLQELECDGGGVWLRDDILAAAQALNPEPPK